MKEVKMIDLINADLDTFSENANKLDIDSFTAKVYESFTGTAGSFNRRHYVMLVPVSLDMYYDNSQHQKFEKYGFCQEGVEERFFNLFFATESVVNEMAEILRYEGLTVEKAFDKIGQRDIYVATLNGIKESCYMEDYQNQKEE